MESKLQCEDSQHYATIKQHQPMECLYFPELTHDTSLLSLDGDEFVHAKALRLRESARILLSNGQGLCAEAELLRMHTRVADFEVRSFFPLHGEAQKSFALAMGILDNKDRLELVVEKAVELGASAIYLVHTRFASQRGLQTSRLLAKSISALKQCKRSVLPRIMECSSLQDFLHQTSFDYLVICDENGQTPSQTAGSTCAVIGPEGGFHKEELELLSSQPQRVLWNLAASRLRSETAAISALSLMSAL